MQLEKRPFCGFNNRKKTSGRKKANARVQSIPVYDGAGSDRKLIGYKYITHIKD